MFRAFILPRFLSLSLMFDQVKVAIISRALLFSFLSLFSLQRCSTHTPKDALFSLLSSSQQTPSLGSPETYPRRDIRAATQGGSITLGHPMWKRLQEIIPWDILPVIRWDQQKDRGLYLCYHALSISYFGCPVSAFLHDFIWLSCSAFLCDFYLIAKSTFDHDASPLSIFSWSFAAFRAAWFEIQLSIWLIWLYF